MAVEAHAQLLSLTEEVEFGLRTPDGSILWPPETYRGYEFTSPEQRSGFLDVLVSAATEMKLEPGAFVTGFGWVPRSKTTFVVSRIADAVLDIATRWDVSDAESTPERVEGPSGSG